MERGTTGRRLTGNGNKHWRAPCLETGTRRSEEGRGKRAVDAVPRLRPILLCRGALPVLKGRSTATQRSHGNLAQRAPGADPAPGKDAHYPLEQTISLPGI